MDLKDIKSWQLALVGAITQITLLLLKTPSDTDGIVIFLGIIIAILPPLLLFFDKTAQGGALISLIFAVSTLKMGLNIAGVLALIPWLFFFAAGIHWYNLNYSMIKKRSH